MKNLYFKRIILFIIIVTIGGVIVYQSLKTKNKVITTLTSSPTTTSSSLSITLPTPPSNWVSFLDKELGVEFKVPPEVKVKIYKPPIHSFSDYYSQVSGLIEDGTTFRVGAEPKIIADYYYNLYQKGGTTLKIFYNDTGEKFDRFFYEFNNKLLVVFNNPLQLSFNEWKNAFEFCNDYNPAISIFRNDACPLLECLCNAEFQVKYEIFAQIPEENNLTVYLGNNDYNFIAFLPLKDKIYITSKAYRKDLRPPSISIEEAKKDFLNSTELKILSSLRPISK